MLSSLILTMYIMNSELRKQIDKARDDTQQFREREKESQMELERLQEEEKVMQQRTNKKVFMYSTLIDIHALLIYIFNIYFVLLLFRYTAI